MTLDLRIKKLEKQHSIEIPPYSDPRELTTEQIRYRLSEIHRVRGDPNYLDMLNEDWWSTERVEQLIEETRARIAETRANMTEEGLHEYESKNQES